MIEASCQVENKYDRKRQNEIKWGRIRKEKNITENVYLNLS